MPVCLVWLKWSPWRTMMSKTSCGQDPAVQLRLEMVRRDEALRPAARRLNVADSGRTTVGQELEREKRVGRPAFRRFSSIASGVHAPPFLTTTKSNANARGLPPRPAPARPSLRPG